MMPRVLSLLIVTIAFCGDMPVDEQTMFEYEHSQFERTLVNGWRALVIQGTVVERRPTKIERRPTNNPDFSVRIIFQDGDVQMDTATLWLTRKEAPPVRTAAWGKEHAFYLGWMPDKERTRRLRGLNVYDVIWHSDHLLISYSVNMRVRVDVVEQQEGGEWVLHDTIELFEQRDSAASPHLVRTGRFVKIGDDLFLSFDVTRRNKNTEVWKVTRDSVSEVPDAEVETLNAVRRAMADEEKAAKMATEKEE